MTVEEMKKSPKLMLTPSDISEVLECHPQSIRQQAKADPSKFGFPVIVMGTRVRIPKVPFLQFMGAWVQGKQEGCAQ